MPGFAQTPKLVLRLIHLPPRLAYKIGLAPLIGRYILLLTTIGRKTGKSRVTPLQYDEIDGSIYIGAARGLQADWVRNILVKPLVQVRIKSRIFSGLAEVITDAKRIADFMEIRLLRHPKMVGAILKSEGLKIPSDRHQLEEYSANLALVIIKPVQTSQMNNIDK